jgi:hypothetical protein
MASFKTLRRTGKIWQQVSKALYPFDDASPVVFDAKGKIVSPGKQAIFNAKGKIVGYRKRKKSFREVVYRQLPHAAIRRFAFFCDSGPEPKENEVDKFRRLLLGTARRILLREQLKRIRNLPHLPGGGRLSSKNKEPNEILQRFEKLKNNPEIGTATKAVEALAKGLDYKERSVWKILRRAKRS